MVLVSTRVHREAQVIILMAIRISNDFYGSDVMYAHELEKGYTRQIYRDQYPVLSLFQLELSPLTRRS